MHGISMSPNGMANVINTHKFNPMIEYFSFVKVSNATAQVITQCSAMICYEFVSLNTMFYLGAHCYYILIQYIVNFLLYMQDHISVITSPTATSNGTSDGGSFKVTYIYAYHTCDNSS
jgi:hypothetical protein